MRSSAVSPPIVLHRLRVIVRRRLAMRFQPTEGLEIGSDDFDTAEYLEWANTLAICKPSYEEVVTLLLALAPHLQPNFFNHIIAEHLPEGGDFIEFGGVKGTNHRGILPTGETAQFVLGGEDMEKRLEVQR